MTVWFPFHRLFQSAGPTVAEWPPPVLVEEPDESATQRVSPTAAPIHVVAGSATIRVKESTLVVERHGEPPFERPIELVSALHIHGWGTVTSPAIAALLANGTPVVWRGATGFPIGYSAPLHAAGLEVRRAQYGAGAAQTLAIARSLVAAKVVNMRGVARRKATLRGREKLAPLEAHVRAARHASSIGQLLGIEGAATASYFGIWPDLIGERAGEVTWTGRERRPPRDMINVLLSYSYALLAGECLCAVAASGLDPRLGFLHQPRPRRAALALDLMEPFRPLIADQAVLAGVNNGQVTPALFEHTDTGLRFTDDGRRLAISLVEARMTSTLTLSDRAEPTTFRAAIGLQARALAGALRDNTSFMSLERP